jgi:hypothetical protein
VFVSRGAEKIAGSPELCFISDLVGRRDLVLRATKIVLIDPPVIQRGIGDCNQGWQAIAASSLARA